MLLRLWPCLCFGTTIYPSQVSISVINTMSKSKLGKKSVYLAYTFRYKGNSGAGTWRQDLMPQAFCLPASSPWLAQTAFLHHPELPAQGWHHPRVDWTLPYHSLFKKCPRVLSIGQSDGGIFSGEAPLPRRLLLRSSFLQNPSTCTSFWDTEPIYRHFLPVYRILTKFAWRPEGGKSHQLITEARHQWHTHLCERM